MKTTLYTAYHRATPRLQSTSVQPIHVGRANAAAPLPNMLGDDTGDNISSRNPYWCELTALYWAWKNDQTSDAIGLMHYRRVLDLTDREPDGPVEQRQRFFDSAEWCAEAEDWLAREGANWDIVLPRVHKMGRSVEENYKHGHAPQDWDVLREIIGRDYPDYVESFETVSAGRIVRLANMAVMQRPLFDRYCTWLFDILMKVEAAPVDRSWYSVQQGRYLGFLSERLMTVFVLHETRTNPDLRLKEVSILNLGQALMTPYIAPEDAPAPETVNIALAADRNYLPHAAAMLRSLMDHADPARPLNIFFLYSDISEHALKVFESMLNERPGTTLHALDTGGMFDKSYRSASRAPSNATYNRFLLFSLLPGLERLLYLDSDMILRHDVCALYDTDLGEAHLGAVPDWIMTRTLTGPTKTIDPDVPELSVYHRETLGLSSEEIARYFNAGVLLFNFAAMGDLRGLGAELMREAQEGRYLFRDQDILNVHFKDKLHVLDPRWNVFNSHPEAYGRVPAAGQAQAMAARKDPWAIHYADRDYKPWRPRPVPQAGHYWQALIRTPFYGEITARLNNATTPRRTISSNGAKPNGAAPPPVERLERDETIVRMGRALAERVPALKGPLLRIYANMRKN